MIRPIVAVVIGLLFFLPAHSGTASAQDVATEAREFMVWITVWHEHQRSMRNGVLGPPHFHHTQGSGTIISPEGYVLTNAHVLFPGLSERFLRQFPNEPLRQAAQVDVTYQGQLFSASITGKDILSDLAMIKIDADRQFPAVTRGLSQNLKAGQTVFAVGFPGRLNRTMPYQSRGTISLLSGTISSSILFHHIVTHTQLGPGMSGGALLDEHARIIGIPVSMTPNSSEGYFIPLHKAQPLFYRLRTGDVNRGGFPGVYVIGVRTLHTDPQLRYAYEEQLHLTAPPRTIQGGVAIQTLPIGSPLAAAGLKRGDIVLTINGKPVDDAVAFYAEVMAAPPGTKLDIAVRHLNETLARSYTVETIDVDPIAFLRDF